MEFPLRRLLTTVALATTLTACGGTAQTPPTATKAPATGPSATVAAATVGTAAPAATAGTANPAVTVSPTVAATTAVTPTTAATAATAGTAAPAATTATTGTGEISTVEFGTLKTYEHASGVFSIDIPENWKLKDNSKPDEILHLWTDPTGNGAVVVDIVESSSTYTAEELTTALTKFLTTTFGSEPDFTNGDPKTQTDGSVLIAWGYTVKTGSVSVKLLGNSFIEQKGNKISILTTLLPSEQFATIKAKADAIINSYKITEGATLSTGGTSATPEAGTGGVAPIEFGTIQPYEHESGVFSIGIPENWTLEDSSKPGEILNLWTDPTGNGVVVVDIAESSTTSTADELTTALNKFLKATFGTKPDFTISDPKTQSDGSVRVTWGYT
ncbi:MAG: hypothetical protein WCP31_11685, partial [Chloroflexales bacterium]